MRKVTGHKITLQGDRSVFVGHRDDDSGDYYIQIQNGPSVKRLKFTAEGAIALRKLLYTGDGAGEPASFEVGDEESTLKTWQLSKAGGAA